MGEYVAGLRRRNKNLMFMNDGIIAANYLLRGVNANPYNTSTIEACQDANELLFSQLSRVRTSDVLLLGAKARTPSREIYNRCVRRVPDFTNPKRYGQLRSQINAFHNHVRTGRYVEHQRIYWMSIAMPFQQSWQDRLLASLAVVDPHKNVTEEEIIELEKEYFRALPVHFEPVRTTPDHVRWMHDRYRNRGIQAPEMTSNMAVRPTVDGEDTFPQIFVNKNADTIALFEEFADQVRPGLLDELNSKQRKRFFKKFKENFRTMEHARALSVHSPETRSRDFPDGYPSYQTQMMIAQYPDLATFDVNAFTYIADQDTKADTDFALRIDFSQDVISKTGIQQKMKELNSEDKATTKDVLDAEDFADRRGEMRGLRRSIKNEKDPRGMRVAAIFSFAHQSYRNLEERVNEIHAHFTKNDFEPAMVVGGQYEMWKAMMPGQACPNFVDKYKQVSTAKLFSGFMPVRRTVAGDPYGVPLAINKENALGQIIHQDLIGATDKGNGSQAITGAKNKGKSTFLKTLLGWFNDLELHAHVIDQSRHLEYLVYAQSLGDPEVVDTVNGNKSMDILKIFPPEIATRVFMETWGRLVGATRGTEERAILLRLLDPKMREILKIRDTRDLINHIVNHEKDPAAKNLSREFLGWGREPYTRVLIDPEGAEPLPAFNATKKIVVFVHNALSVDQQPNSADGPSDAEMFSTLVLTVIAEYTAWRFSQIRETCGLLGDEVHFLAGSTVLGKLIGRYDKTARAEGNVLAVASQLEEHFDHNYKLINKRWVLGQETAENSRPNLIWGGVPPTQTQIKKHLAASPADASRGNLPVRGREAEGWYNDGTGNVVWCQQLPHLQANRRRHADTTTSTAIRGGELTHQGAHAQQEQPA
ncbi:hypothetical protein [Mycobacteroides abscessus]|uniref:hypothetical protein n=1 Tax=Mycobacteroides abscessus TaxID=36809 RepID=UPI0009D47D35|nr:hypothetical protein [Mycobacteroides abscessus]SLC72895.1 Type IV secretory pathway, VirB4 components [Mycobacteroides abscessus subsp. massiliense]SLJ50874.1 Type IV secretory pathway, VirB4 components [Mycobacteroides abscessus subsp. abscessus]